MKHKPSNKNPYQPLVKLARLIDDLGEKKDASTHKSEADVPDAPKSKHDKPLDTFKWEYHGKLNTVHLFRLKKDGEFDNAILFILPTAQASVVQRFHVIYEKISAVSSEKKYDMLDANQIEHIFGINVANIIKEGDISYNGLLRHIHSNINDLQGITALAPEDQLNKIKDVLHKFFYGQA